MADYTEKKVVREYIEWTIPVRSLGSLPEWAKLQAAIVAVIGQERAEQHGALAARVDGEDDDPMLVLSYQLPVPQVIPWGEPRWVGPQRGGPILTPREVVDLGRRTGGIAVASPAVGHRLAALIGDKDSSDADLRTAVDDVPLTIVTVDEALFGNRLRIGDQVYLLEGNGRAYLLEPGAHGLETPS